MLLSYYGDDFTGSTDVMEALAIHGVKTVLFTRMPVEREFKAFANHDAIGLAGTSRSQTPQWMDGNLSPAFEWLKSLGAQFCHYKVCSTFDSSPSIGNIGKAIEIARAVFGQHATPLVIGAPQLKRYTAFGHLFAGYRGQTYRIDRHPVMCRHPVTPMDEADLRIHLARQTTLPVELVPANLLNRENLDHEVDAIITATRGIVLFDVLDATTQAAVGKQLLRLRQDTGPFLAGSSGIEYALVRALSAAGSISGHASFKSVSPVERIIAVSGSCSPTTARQIRHALAHGFEGIAADPLLLAGEGASQEITRLTAMANRAFEEGSSVLIYTALEGDDNKSAILDTMPQGRNRVGQALGQIASGAIRRHHLTRVIIAGGDTSSHALSQLDVFALTTRFPLNTTPGSPLCKAYSTDPSLDGIEIAMKGGQVGGDDYFVVLRDGIAS